MSYKYLSERLRPAADGAERYFRNRWGITNFRKEQPIDDELEYAPTLHAVRRDHHYLCIEVSESPYPSGLDAFVLDCMRSCRPVHLYVAVPTGATGESFQNDLSRARNLGVGVLQVANKTAREYHPSLSLSLTGVRRVQPKLYPQKYRLPLSEAEQTFIGGNPPKGCSMIYDELEDLTRRLARKTKLRNMWRPLRPGEKLPRIRKHTQWSLVVRTLMDHLDRTRCPYVSVELLGRVLGITSHRNESAHKPQNMRHLIRRDRELRTRFESAVDLLFDFVVAVRPLRI